MLGLELLGHGESLDGRHGNRCAASEKSAEGVTGQEKARRIQLPGLCSSIASYINKKKKNEAERETTHTQCRKNAVAIL